MKENTTVPAKKSAWLPIIAFAFTCAIPVLHLTIPVEVVVSGTFTPLTAMLSAIIAVVLGIISICRGLKRISWFGMVLAIFSVAASIYFLLPWFFSVVVLTFFFRPEQAPYN